MFQVGDIHPLKNPDNIVVLKNPDNIVVLGYDFVVALTYKDMNKSFHLSQSQYPYTM